MKPAIPFKKHTGLIVSIVILILVILLLAWVGYSLGFYSIKIMTPQNICNVSTSCEVLAFDMNKTRSTADTTIINDSLTQNDLYIINSPIWIIKNYSG